MTQAYCQRWMTFKIATARRLRAAALMSLVFVLCACAQSIVIADDLDRASLATALQRSQSYLVKLPSDRVIGELPRRLTAGEALDSLRVLQELLQQWDCWNCFVEQVRKRFDLLSATS